jgi:hypothetical protein
VRFRVSPLPHSSHIRLAVGSEKIGLLRDSTLSTDTCSTPGVESGRQESMDGGIILRIGPDMNQFRFRTVID